MNLKTIFIAILLFILIGSYSQTESIHIQASFDYVVYPIFGYPFNEDAGSYKIGGGITYYFSDRVGISTGLAYEKKSFTVDHGDFRWVLETFDLRYVNWPIKFDFKVLETKSNHLSLKSGIEFGGLLSADRFVEYQDGRILNSESGYQFLSPIHNLTFGILYRFFLYRDIYLGAYPNLRYNITNSQGIQGNTGQGTALSYGFQISLGYRFNLKNKPIP